MTTRKQKPKAKHVTETGWAVWNVAFITVPLMVSPVFRDRESAQEWRQDRILEFREEFKNAGEDSYRCLRTTAKGEI